MEGVQDAVRGGHRVGSVEIVLDEMAATRKALDRSRPGDLVVLCVDYATEVWKELERRSQLAQPRILQVAEGDGQIEAVGGDPDILELEPSL
jgi:cyanophycin synthetase